MAKQGMARPDWTHTKPKNEVPPVPEIQGKAKHGKERAKPIVSGTSGPELKVFHELRGVSSADGPFTKPVREERPIAAAYPVIDTDLGRDNLENDLPAADLEDLSW